MDAADTLGLEHLVREFLREEKAAMPWYIILPASYAKMGWDFAVLAIALVAAVTLPLQLSYHDMFDESLDDGLETFHTLMLVVYGFDVVFGLFTSFQVNNGEWALTLRETVANYLRTWFAVDVLACVPWGFVQRIDAAGPAVPVLSLVKTLRLSRVLTTKVGSSLGMTSVLGLSMRFVRMLGIIALLVHWVACLFHAASPAEDTHAHLSPAQRYVLQLYNAFCMLLGERLTQEEPTTAQAVIAMIAMLTGALVVATVFGNVAVLVASFNITRTRLQEKMDRINESMKSCHLSGELQATIRHFYLYSWARHKESASQAFIDDLSPGLRRRLLRQPSSWGHSSPLPALAVGSVGSGPLPALRRSR